MPIYEYRCTECRRVFELLVRSPQSADDRACPACGAKSVDRVPSRFASHGGAVDGGESCAPSFGGG